MAKSGEGDDAAREGDGVAVVPWWRSALGRTLTSRYFAANCVCEYYVWLRSGVSRRQCVAFVAAGCSLPSPSRHRPTTAFTTALPYA